MALHPRQKIREAAKAALVGKTAAGAKVYETRTVPFRLVDCPAISVYTPGDSVDVDRSLQSSTRTLDRTLTLEIVAAVKGGGNVDDDLDAIALEIERAMHLDWTLGGTCADSILTDTETDVKKDGDQFIGFVLLEYTVFYTSEAPDHSEAPDLDALESVDVRYSLKNQQAPADRANDLITGLGEEE